MEYISAVLLATAILCGLIAVLRRFTKGYHFMKRLPGPELVPIFGNLWEFFGISNEGVFKLMRHCSKKYGTFRLWSMGIGHIHTSRAREAEILMSSSKHIDKSEIYYLIHDFLGTGLLVSNGKKWQQRRKILTPAFHFNILQQFAAIFNEESQKMVDLIEKKIEKGRNVIDVGTITCRFTLNIICETAMGVKLDSLENADEYRYNIYRIGEVLIHRLMRPWLYVEWIFKILGFQKQMNKHLIPIHSFTRNIIKTRRNAFIKANADFEDLHNENIYETRKRRYAMLDTLLASETENLIDEEGICEEVDTFMFEGHDTTSSGLTFILLLLATNEEVQEKLYEEIKEAIDQNNGQPLSITQFGELSYLDRVIKECLRIYPPVTFISRTLSDEIVLNDIKIRPGKMIHLHIYDVHRDPTYYPDPEKFDPDRFLPENVEKRSPYAYIPFSAGPRNCIGQKFAMLELKTAVQFILLNFRLKAVTQREDVIFVADLVLRTKNPIYVKFEKR